MTTTPKTLTTDECDLMINAFASHQVTSKRGRKDIRNYTMFILMLDAGLRVGEVVHLQIFDLWFNSLPVTSIIIRPEIAKNKTERIIPVSQRLSNALKNMHEYIWTPCGKTGFDFAFTSNFQTGTLTTRQVERIIRAAAMKSLGRPVHPHMLRHTFATRLMRKTNSRVVQELLGHSSMTSTQIYTHPNEDDKRKAIIDVEHSENSTHPDYNESPTQ